MKELYSITYSFILLCTCFFVRIDAQPRILAFSDIDTKLKSVGSADSIIYYLKLGAQLSREKDHLYNWVSYTLEYLDQSEVERRAFNESKRYNVWRDPVNAQEAFVAVRFYSRMGYNYARDGNIPLSTDYYSRAQDLFDTHQPNNIDLFEEILKPLGNHFLRLGDFERATNVLYRMQEFVTDRSDPDAEAAMSNFDGLIFKLKGEPQKAVAAYQRGLTLSKANPAIRGKLASNLSLLWSELGDDVMAERYALEALKHLDRIPSPDEDVYADVALTYLIIAQVKMHRHDLSDAYEYINTALNYSTYSDKRTYAKMLVVHGQVMRQAGYPEHAIEDFNAVLAQFIQGFSPGDPFENPQGSSLPAENTVFEALEGKADACADMSKSTGDQKYLIYGLQCHKLALEAELLLRRQLSTEVSRNILSADSKRRNSKALEMLNQLMQHEQRQDFATDALFLMEATKANSVLEAVYLRLQDADSAAIHNPAAVELIERLRVEERILQNLQRDQSDVDEIRRGERVINQLKLQLAEIRTGALPNFNTYAQILDTQIADRSINASRIIRDSTAVFIEYFLQNDRGYAVVVRDAEVSFIALRDVVEISTITRDLLEMLHSRTALQSSPEEFGRHAYWLYERLIHDVIKNAGGLTALIIVPDGILNYLPFEVLLSRWDSTMSYAQMPFLIRDVAIQYVYSAGVLSLQDQIKSPFEKGIAFAPFDQDHRGFAELSYSIEEIANARKRMGLQAYTGGAASFGKFIALAAESRIIHLATHAGIDSMGEGRIEFADSSMWLTDIYYLPLQCDLAILSACESAFGENTPSEGIQNFARAFALAGTKTILASHWRLNDAAGAMIMGSFYQHLQQGHTISSALRHAKLDYLKDPDIPAMRKSPHYWATFVMVGSDDHVAVRRAATIWYVAFGMMILIAGCVLYYRRRNGRKLR